MSIALTRALLGAQRSEARDLATREGTSLASARPIVQIFPCEGHFGETPRASTTHA